jgi:hypothetical protein
MFSDKTYLKERPMKKHKTLRTKIVKRRENEKKIKKTKHDKKQKFSKLGEVINDATPEQLNMIKIHRLLQNYEEKFPSEVSDLLQVFRFIDSKDEVDISDIENEEAKRILEALFGILGIEGNNGIFKVRNSSKTEYYTYVKEISTGGIEFIKGLISRNNGGDSSEGDEKLESENYGSYSEDSLNDENEEQLKAENMSIGKKGEGHGQPTDKRFIKNPENDRQLDKRINQLPKQVTEKTILSPKLISESKKTSEFLKKYGKRPDDARIPVRSGVTEDRFAQSTQKSQQKVTQSNERFQSNNSRSDSLRPNSEKLCLENPKKSLLQIHQERQEALKSDDFKRTSFKKDDLGKTVDPKALFKVVTNPNFNISKNFTEAKYHNSFI